LFPKFSIDALARSEVQGYQIFVLLFFTRVLFLGILNEILPFLNVFTGQFISKIVRSV